MGKTRTDRPHSQAAGCGCTIRCATTTTDEGVGRVAGGKGVEGGVTGGEGVGVTGGEGGVDENVGDGVPPPLGMGTIGSVVVIGVTSIGTAAGEISGAGVLALGALADDTAGLLAQVLAGSQGISAPCAGIGRANFVAL